MNIPFVDLKAQYNHLKVELDSAIQQVIEEGAFIGGTGNPFVNSFEKNFSSFLEGAPFFGCANGTDSLEIILTAYGIGPGDKVLVPALTWISTAECVTNVGAIPVFVDVKPDTYTIDENKIEDLIDSTTKAIIPVHLYGNPAEMDRIMTIARSKNIWVIEDCAQSHGARYKGTITGTIGDASSFSFYPGKNLGAYGDAGGISIKDPQVFETARRIANHGQISKNVHSTLGRNSRMDGIQAAILDIKLKYLQSWNKQRQRVADAYRDQLSGTDIQLPTHASYAEHVFHLFVVRIKNNRSGIIEGLKKNGIATAIHYPAALPDLDVFAKFQQGGRTFPVASKACEEILSLPIYPEMTENHVQYVCDCLIKLIR